MKADKPISYETLKEQAKSLRLPSRSKLTRVFPMDEEQVQMFIRCQKDVPAWFKRMGIKIVGCMYLWPDGEYRDTPPDEPDITKNG